jgi:hypothetical protein
LKHFFYRAAIHRTQTAPITLVNRRRGAFPAPPNAPAGGPQIDPQEISQRESMMRPFRAFLFAFTAGLAVLFSGHGAITAATASPPNGTITV